MSEKEAISAGTYKAAQFLGLDDRIGSVRLHHDADLILTDKNPLDDISYIKNKDNIKLVVRDGHIFKNHLNN
ncbi:MAG: amidohydrolase family protein, partial [Methanobrevibacter boviskoreani]